MIDMYGGRLYEVSILDDRVAEESCLFRRLSERGGRDQNNASIKWLEVNYEMEYFKVIKAADR